MEQGTTVKRNWLRKQIELGNVEIKCEMVLTDDYAYDAATNCQKSDWAKADIKDFRKEDFKYKSGWAHWNYDNTIDWTMLYNHYYKCRLINPVK